MELVFKLGLTHIKQIHISYFGAQNSKKSLEQDIWEFYKDFIVWSNIEKNGLIFVFLAALMIFGKISLSKKKKKKESRNKWAKIWWP